MEPIPMAQLADEGTVMETTSVNTPPLTAQDRCDLCQAQAYVRVVNIKTDHDLLFCHHHWTTVEKSGKFNDDNWFIWDESSKLNAVAKLDVSV